MTVQGAILCGGRSSRFGSDKALAPLLQNDLPAVVSLHNLLASLQLNPIVLSGNANRYAVCHMEGIDDTFKNCGPLSGLHAGLSQSHAHALLVLTVDMPQITSDDLNILLAAYQKNKWPTFFTVAHNLSPFPAIYTKDMLPQILQNLQTNEHAIQTLIKSLTNKNTIFHNSAEHFSNINTHQDWCDLKTKELL